MNKILTGALAIALCATAAEARSTMKYQTLVCDAAGAPMTETALGFMVTIHEGTATGDNVLIEEYTTTTTPAGMAYLNIGSASEGTLLEELDWAGKTYFLEVSVDRGQGYVSLGSQQILSVPRAIHAATAEAVILTSPSGKKFKVTINENGELTTVPVTE